jgi:pyridinium-3,5-bisthiocarboxylic acid mononucleotide nickel chelatase
MRIGSFDPFSGASGDMVLGALVDAGLALAELQEELGKIAITGYQLESELVEQNAVRGTRVRMTVDGDQPARDWASIRSLVEDSALSDGVRLKALAVFEALALAESAVHGVPVDEVHFHEVGAVDSIIDICGVAIGLETLGIDQLYSGPVRVGAGFVSSQHGMLPVPAPATAYLLASAGAPMLGMPLDYFDVQAELLTPTGAAILTTLALFEHPSFKPDRVAYGFGSRELPWPNTLRLWLGEASSVTEPKRAREGLVVLETNVDDMSPQAYEMLTERLFAGGALDVWLTPVHMKKGRPGIVASTLAQEERRDALEQVLFGNSTTLGVRSYPVDRTVLERKLVTATTRFGDVRLKLRIRDGRVLDAMPEYDDCARIARQHDRPFLDVWEEAKRAGDRFAGLASDAEALKT